MALLRASSRPRATSDFRRRRPLRLVVALSLVVTGAIVAAACGGGNATPTAVQKTDAGVETSTLRLKADRTYSIADLEAAGWKKSKQLSHELLPSAQAAWYGFFEQRDIEVRVYATYTDAAGPGEASASQAIVRTQSPNVGGGALISGDNRLGYHAYVVAGNLVLLCERSVDDCLNLVNRLR